MINYTHIYIIYIYICVCITSYLNGGTGLKLGPGLEATTSMGPKGNGGGLTLILIYPKYAPLFQLNRL